MTHRRPDPPEIDERFVETSLWDPKQRPKDPYVAWLERRLAPRRYRRRRRAAWLWIAVAASLLGGATLFALRSDPPPAPPAGSPVAPAVEAIAIEAKPQPPAVSPSPATGTEVR
jgi:hypothetical protein